MSYIFFEDPGKQLAYTRVDFTTPAGDLVAYGCVASFYPLPYTVFLTPFHIAHTKYVGKSSMHEVSDLIQYRRLFLKKI
jgi:hypothetical protein